MRPSSPWTCRSANSCFCLAEQADGGPRVDVPGGDGASVNVWVPRTPTRPLTATFSRPTDLAVTVQHLRSMIARCGLATCVPDARAGAKSQRVSLASLSRRRAAELQLGGHQGVHQPPPLVVK